MTLKPEDHALIARLMARQPNLMLRGHEGYYRHEDIIEAVQLIGRLAAAREESRPDPRPSPVGREEVRDRIARLVWFMALEEVDVTSALHPNNDAAWEHWRNESESAPSRACADAILALLHTLENEQ